VQTWQKSAVTGYLARAAGQLPEASMFNASGRGYSDLAAVGDNNICVRVAVACVASRTVRR